LNPTTTSNATTKARSLLSLFKIAVATTTVITIVVCGEGFFRHYDAHPMNSPVYWLLAAGPVIDLTVRILGRAGQSNETLAYRASAVRHFGLRSREAILANAHLLRICLLGALAVFGAVWIPEYLVQPIWTDHEHMLVMAQLWNSGEFPWTAMRTYQFPGGMEMAWLSARLFGWGNPVGVYATHLLLMGTVGAVLMKWSKNVLGHWGYGIVGLAALVSVEASLPFTIAAQRDTQTTLILILAMLSPMAFRRRSVGLVASAAAYAFALATRPHGLIFVPLVLCGIFWLRLVGPLSPESTEFDERYETGFARPIDVWLIAFFFALACFLSPILGPNRTPSFLEAMRFPFSQPGDYSRGAFALWENTVEDMFAYARHILFLVISVSMILVPNRRPWKRTGAVMLLVAFSGGIYRAVHPVDHGYMKVPLQVWECLALSIFFAWVVSKARTEFAFTWFSAFGYLAMFAVPTLPLYVNLQEWRDSVTRLVNETPMPNAPPGASHAYPREPNRYHYGWSDWMHATAWLRAETDRDTRILNLLSFQPYPAFLGTLGRMPLGRLESLVMLNWFEKYDFDTEIIESLRQAPSGSLVIWDSDRTNSDNRAQIARSSVVIRELFREKARFGEIEIWQKP
jgi:hypothetical protein